MFDDILVLVQGNGRYLRTRVLTIDTFQQPYKQQCGDKKENPTLPITGEVLCSILMKLEEHA